MFNRCEGDSGGNVTDDDDDDLTEDALGTYSMTHCEAIPVAH